MTPGAAVLACLGQPASAATTATASVNGFVV